MQEGFCCALAMQVTPAAADGNDLREPLLIGASDPVSSFRVHPTWLGVVVPEDLSVGGGVSLVEDKATGLPAADGIGAKCEEAPTSDTGATDSSGDNDVTKQEDSQYFYYAVDGRCDSLYAISARYHVSIPVIKQHNRGIWWNLRNSLRGVSLLKIPKRADVVTQPPGEFALRQLQSLTGLDALASKYYLQQHGGDFSLALQEAQADLAWEREQTAKQKRLK